MIQGNQAKQKNPNKQNKRKGKWLYRIGFLIALSVFLYAAAQLFIIFKANWDEQREVNRVNQAANLPENPNEPFVVNWDELRKLNEDVIAWLMIPDTNISYPIVQGDDNEYYLKRTFEKAENYAGAIFMDMDNKKDFSDNNTLIYGHNTRHGTMFSKLEAFLDEDFFDKHPYIYLFTPEQNYRCELISFHSTKDSSAFYTLHTQDSQAWQTYRSLINGDSLDGFVHADVSVAEGDRIISLSTCSYEIDNDMNDQRYLLHAKLVPWDGPYTEQLK